MQPEPRRVLTPSPHLSPTPNASQLRQHGLHFDHDSSSHPSPSLDGGDGSFEGSTSEWSLSGSSSGSPVEGYDTWLNPSRWDANQATEIQSRHSQDQSDHVEELEVEEDQTLRLQFFPEGARSVVLLLVGRHANCLIQKCSSRSSRIYQQPI